MKVEIAAKLIRNGEEHDLTVHIREETLEIKVDEIGREYISRFESSGTGTAYRRDYFTPIIIREAEKLCKKREKSEI